MLAGVPVHEQGPLARCAPFMDTAARRVLPGHLLRRARVLSSFQVSRTQHSTAQHIQTPLGLGRPCAAAKRTANTAAACTT